MNARPEISKIDLHCHSEASGDCVTPIASIPARCLERGITVQAITDHDEIWGAQKIKEYASQNAEYKHITFIVGEEVSTAEGEIIGLFLTERINPHQTPEETVRQIKAQGGLVLIPHAFDPLKRFRLSPVARERIIKDIDIIESFNARISNPRWNDAASLWAAEKGFAQSAGSDAHTLHDIGCAWTESPIIHVETPEDLLTALKESKIQGMWTHPVIAFYNKTIYYLRHGWQRFQDSNKHNRAE